MHQGVPMQHKVNGSKCNRVHVRYGMTLLIARMHIFVLNYSLFELVSIVEC